MKDRILNAKNPWAIAFTAIAAAAIVLACGVLAYGAIAPVQADAEIETITNEIDPQEQQAFTELAATIDAETASTLPPYNVAEADDAADQASADSATSGAEDATQAAASDDAQANADDQAATPAGDCIATINYLEYQNYDDPDAVVDEEGRRVLGTRTLTGLHEGDVLHAWDYVVDIPGHFFFDGWPLNLTITTDPAQNEFDLIYIKTYDAEFTVNYYVMTGANLTADNWTDALAPDTVEFTKLGSETFVDQRFDTLVEGDAYEYKLDGMYVIDTYPPEIRLGSDPDDNVINVLYASELTNLPDDKDDVVGDATTPPSDDNGNKPLPPDGTVTPGEIDDAFQDFVNSGADNGQVNITDWMLQHPVDKQEALRTINAYKTGIEGGSLAQTGDNTMTIVWVLVGVAAVAIVAAVVTVVVRRRKTNQQ